MEGTGGPRTKAMMGNLNDFTKPEKAMGSEDFRLKTASFSWPEKFMIEREMWEIVYLTVEYKNVIR